MANLISSSYNTQQGSFWLQINATRSTVCSESLLLHCCVCRMRFIHEICVCVCVPHWSSCCTRLQLKTSEGARGKWLNTVHLPRARPPAYTQTWGQSLHPRAPNGQHVSLSQSRSRLHRETRSFQKKKQTLSNHVEGPGMTVETTNYQPSEANNTILHKGPTVSANG